MAIPMREDITSDQLDCIFSEFKPNTILKITGVNNTGKTTVLCNRNQTLGEGECKILLLSTSKSSLEKIKRDVGDDTVLHTFKTYIESLLQELNPKIKLITTAVVNEFEKELKVDSFNTVSFDKMKKSIEVISAISSYGLNKMDDYETSLRFGLSKNNTLKLKKLVGNTFYVSYSQIMKQILNLNTFLDIKGFSKSYSVISVMNFHNLTTDEVNFLILTGGGKHITIIENEAQTVKPLQVEKNWELLKCNYKANNVKEVRLTKVFDEKEKTLEYASLKERYQANKINSENIEQVFTSICTTFNDLNSDLALLQIISLIPGIQDKFVCGLCDLASKEDGTLFQFLEKYQDSFSENIKLTLLPVISYLNMSQTKLDKTNPNSIMIHFLNFYNLLNIKNDDKTDMKQDFVNLHMWFKKFNQSKHGHVAENLLEGYINKKALNRSPKLTNLSSVTPPFSVESFIAPSKAKMSGTISINLPVSISLNKNNDAKPNIKTEPIATPLRRSGSAKYKARPRSWHAGSLINAARRLR